jgi:DNA-binding response OmpR family regulator
MEQQVTFSGNILVADDEKVNVEFFEVMLSKLGFSVEVAYSGEEVFEKLKKFNPDLIILDLLMPRMSGFQVAKKLKANKRTSEIPIIILTAVSDIRDKVDMLELGIEDYIMKPFNFIEILARIRNVLRVGALRDELKSYERTIEFLEGFEKSLQLFLKRTQSLSQNLVEWGEKGTCSDNTFVKRVVENGKSQLEQIAEMKNKHQELLQVLEDEESSHAQGKQKKNA